ncbi:MAG: hypothetical protein M1817_004867 [Caeruleum heppii]|nr:MAG: hypothetical protein M1817_004867 [Caeruleum heppii]
MPTYRSITLSLISQFDILTIPEFSPTLSHTLSAQSNPDTSTADPPPSPHSTVSVLIPSYPSSQFWLSYSIAPPHPPRAQYYFKLYLAGRHVVSWGVSERNGFVGKTMFGLFDAGEDWMGIERVERRAFCFGAEGVDQSSEMDEKPVMEVRVFRAKGRKRVPVQSATPGMLKEASMSEETDKTQARRQGVDLINAGNLSRHHAKRFYSYALIDPIDQPFATFRYYCRAWDDLISLEETSPRTSNLSTSPAPQTSLLPSTEHNRTPNDPEHANPPNTLPLSLATPQSLVDITEEEEEDDDDDDDDDEKTESLATQNDEENEDSRTKKILHEPERNPRPGLDGEEIREQIMGMKEGGVVGEGW